MGESVDDSGVIMVGEDVIDAYIAQLTSLLEGFQDLKKSRRRLVPQTVFFDPATGKYFDDVHGQPGKNLPDYKDPKNNPRQSSEPWAQHAGKGAKVYNKITYAH